MKKVLKNLHYLDFWVYLYQEEGLYKVMRSTISSLFLLVSLHLLVCLPSGLLACSCFFTSLICVLLCILFYFLLCFLFGFGFTFCFALCVALCSALCIVLPSFIACGLSTCGCLLSLGFVCIKITLSLYFVLSSLKKLFATVDDFFYIWNSSNSHPGEQSTISAYELVSYPLSPGWQIL